MGIHHCPIIISSYYLSFVTVAKQLLLCVTLLEYGPPDCNLRARSKRECLSVAWYSAASAILKRRAPRRSLWGFDGRQGLDREFDEFEVFINSSAKRETRGREK